MKPLLRSALVCVLLSAKAACSQPAAQPPTPPSAPALFLNQTFELAHARCQVTSARTTLTEAKARSDRSRLKPDVSALLVKVRCHDAKNEEIALPQQTAVLLHGPDGSMRAPSLRTALTRKQPAPGQLVFELPADQRWLRPPLSWNAETGAPSPEVAFLLCRLSFQHGAEKREVVLDQPFHDEAFRAFMNELARGLAQNELSPTLARTPAGQKALSELAQLYQEALTQLSPRRLALVHAEPQGEQLRVTLRLDKPQARGLKDPLAELRLDLQRHSGGQFSVAGTPDDLASVGEGLACAALMQSLEGRIRQAYTTEHPKGDCNALGVLVPGACDASGTPLVGDALRIRARCAPDLERFRAVKLRRLPDDFQLTLRKGKSRAKANKGARYVVSLYGNQRVVFRDRAWARTHQRHDGLTTPALLAKLHHQLHALDWFGRRGGPPVRPSRCGPTGPGDSITLRAGGRERSVVNRPGCRGPFHQDELTQLREAIELAAGVSGWTRPRPGYTDPDAEVWIVRAD